jgi:hypothetical protein
MNNQYTIFRFLNIQQLIIKPHKLVKRKMDQIAKNGSIQNLDYHYEKCNQYYTISYVLNFIYQIQLFQYQLLIRKKKPLIHIKFSNICSKITRNSEYTIKKQNQTSRVKEKIDIPRHICLLISKTRYFLPAKTKFNNKKNENSVVRNRNEWIRRRLRE